MDNLRQKWQRIIEEYEHKERVKGDQSPAIPWTEENVWKILSRRWIDFSHNFMEELSGLFQEGKLEEGLLLLDLMTAKWEELSNDSLENGVKITSLSLDSSGAWFIVNLKISCHPWSVQTAKSRNTILFGKACT